jgi:hypothetical protein
MQNINEALNDKMLLACLNHHVHISEFKMSSLHSTVTKGGVDVPTLARNLGISLEVAKRTRAVTSQRGVKSMIYPSLSRRRVTSDRHMRYRRLHMTLFTDTMFAKINSRQQITEAQIFCTQSSWTRAHLLRKEADAREALSLFAQRYGIPEVLVMDGSKAHNQGKFPRKCREFDIHVKQLEAYNSKSNAAEGVEREFKYRTGCEQLRANSPKVLWDHCLRRQAYVRSYTALVIFSLEGQVPETQVFGNQADISTVAEYAWYEFVNYGDVSVGLPDTNIQLVGDLGTAIDIGPG